MFIEVGGDRVSFSSYVLFRVLLRGNYVHSRINERDVQCLVAGPELITLSRSKIGLKNCLDTYHRILSAKSKILKISR